MNTEQEITDLTERVEQTRTQIPKQRDRADRLRVQIERTKVAYAEGLPVNLLRGTQPDEIKAYAQELKKWKG